MAADKPTERMPPEASESAWFVLAQELANVASWDWNIIEGVTRCSPNYFALYGLPVTRFAPPPDEWLAIIHPDDRARVQREMQAALDGTAEYDSEFRIVCGDGTVRWLAGRGKVLRDESGKATRMLGVNMDITEQKSSQQLRVDNEALARANESLTYFASAAAHDLQAPLRAIHSYVELFVAREGEHLTENGREFLGYIKDGVGRLQQLISGLLSYAKLGRIDPARRRIADLNHCLDAALSSLSPGIQHTHAQITRDPLPELPVDGTLMSLLLQNLIDNAIKYRKTDEAPRVHVTARPGTDGIWQFSVSDNGIGFDSEQAERIFIAFRRLRPYHVSGSGIGLANCKRIVEAHGGRIWAEGEPGRGAVFHFTIPAEAAPGPVET